MSKHTPGPLYADDTGQIWRKSTWDSYINGGKAGEESPIATAHDGWDAEGLEFFPVKANARLFAAAPELLEALERCFDIMNNGGTWSILDQDQCRAAIAKAKGNSHE